MVRLDPNNIYTEHRMALYDLVILKYIVVYIQSRNDC